MNWNRKLSRPLELEDGTTLITLGDAARAIDVHFSTVTASGWLESTIETLMKAAKTGKRADVVEATDSLARQFRHQRVLKGSISPSGRGRARRPAGA